jgi:fused signal recognition particle receptor
MAVKKGLGVKLKGLFRGSSQEEEKFYEELEELLIEADLGSKVTFETVEALRRRVKSEKLRGKEEVAAALRDLLSQHLRKSELTLDPERLNVFLVLGVNGVGKTTTIAKLA